MSLNNVILSILIITVITYFTRALPFIFFRNRKPPEVISYVGKNIPPIIITILVVYCLKDIEMNKVPYGIPEILSAAIVVGLHLWKRNALISIFGGTIFYMFLSQSDLVMKL